VEPGQKQVPVTPESLVLAGITAAQEYALQDRQYVLIVAMGPVLDLMRTA